MQVLLSGDPAVDLDARADHSRGFGSRWRLSGSHRSAPVHVDVALEGRTVCYEHTRSPDVADNPAIAFEFSALTGDDIAGHCPQNRDRGGLDIGLEYAAFLNVNVLAKPNATLHRALHNEVFVAGDLTIDYDRAAYDCVCHAWSFRVCLVQVFALADGLLQGFGQVNVHLDRAIEMSAVVDDDPWGSYVARDLRTALNRDRA